MTLKLESSIIQNSLGKAKREYRDDISYWGGRLYWVTYDRKAT